MGGVIKVAAPRRKAFDPFDPQSPIVLIDLDRRHPENPAYHLPPGELVLCAGDGIEGDPARAKNPHGSPPLLAYETPALAAAIRLGKIVEVKDTADAQTHQLTTSDLGSLTSVSERQVKLLKTSLRAESVEHLADKLASAPNPQETLTGIRGIGPRTAQDLLNELEARGLLEAAE